MEFLKLLLYIGLILTAAMTVYATKNSRNKRAAFLPHEDTMPYDILPIQYQVRLITDIQESNVSYHGECNVSVEILTPMYDIRVHLLEMQIDESATTLLNTLTDVTYKPNNYSYDEIMNTALLTFDHELLPGFYILHTRYSGNSPINPNRFHRTSYTSKEGGRVWLIVMPFTPVAVTGLEFPCWGKPALIHSFNISVKHDHTIRALSNTPPERIRRTSKNGMMWTEFKPTPFMSSCLVAVALTDYVQVYNNKSEAINNVWGRSHLISHMEYAKSVAEKVTKYMAEYTGMPDNEKIDHIAIPNFSRSVFWRLNFYNELDITYDHRIDPSFRRREVAEFITHAVLQQWFGSLVTPAWFSHAWLGRGMVSVYQSYILDKIYKGWRMMDMMVIDKLHESLSKDMEYMMNSTKLQIPNFSETTILYYSIYNKASVILRMLQHIITDEVFQNGIDTYLHKHQFQSTTSDDLWIAMQAALDKSDVARRHADYEIKAVMDTWINQVPYPLVIVTRNYETGETTISQEQFHLQGVGNDTDNKWWVPVTWTTQTSPNFSNTLPDRWLSPSNPSINFLINPNDWIIVNLQQTGYYRVNYDSTNWRKIARYLNSENYTKIHVLNRAQIIDDAFALMMGKYLDISTFYKLTSYLLRETDYVVWYATFRNLERLVKYFSLPESAAFKSYMSKILDGLLKNVGCEEEPNEDDIEKLKRLNVTKWACLVGNLECKRMATAKLEHYITDVDAHKVPVWWQRWMYCSGLKAANKTTWNRVMNLYMQKRNEEFLEFLACSEDSDIIIKYLDAIVSNNMTLQDRDHILAVNSIIIRHARDNPVLDYMLENLERIKPKSLTTVAMLKDIIFHVYTKEQLDKIKHFVKNNFNEKILATILPVIDSRVFALKSLIDSFSARYINEEEQA